MTSINYIRCQPAKTLNWEGSNKQVSDLDTHGLDVMLASGSRVLYKQAAFTGSNLSAKLSILDSYRLAALSVGSDSVQRLHQPGSIRPARVVTFTENHDNSHTVTTVERKGSSTYGHYGQLIHEKVAATSWCNYIAATDTL